MKYLFCIILSLFALRSSGQSPELELSSKQVENNKVRIFTTGNFIGTYTIILTFSQLDNAMGRSSRHFIVKGPGSTLLTLKPINPDKPILYRYRYLYIRGNADAIHNDKIIYRLPYAAGTSRRSSPLNYFKIGKESVKPENFRPMYFRMEKGDTIYAARKGVVVEIRNGHAPMNVEGHVSYMNKSNSVTIEHEDGTLAEYYVLENNSILVQPGDTVYPDTPIALAGTYDNKDYQLRLSITYPSPEEKQDKTGYKFGHVYINPVFDTAEQRDTLLLGNSYTATVTPEIIQQEMTKKELKTRNK